MTAATITTHIASFTLTDGRVRPVELAVVRRKRGGRTTRVVVIDAGAATTHAAHQAAMHFAGGRGGVERRTVDHGSLGTFGMDDAGRDGMLAAVRGLNLGLGEIHVVTSGAFDIAFAGAAPLEAQDSAVHGDSPRSVLS